jgi:hypothetical protein
VHTGRLIFAQLMDCLPLAEFRRCVARYQGEYKVRGFSCLDQFLCLAFAQLTYRESLRDIETCLRAMQPKLYHLGIRGRVARSTLADANETRDWRIYGDFAQALIHRARVLYSDEPLAVELTQTVYAFDATTIDLCLALFPWARFRRTKAAVKLHTLLDLRGPLPTCLAEFLGHMFPVGQEAPSVGKHTSTADHRESLLPCELTEPLPRDHGGGHVIHVCPLGVSSRELREDAVNLVWGMDRHRLDRQVESSRLGLQRRERGLQVLRGA